MISIKPRVKRSEPGVGGSYSSSSVVGGSQCRFREDAITPFRGFVFRHGSQSSADLALGFMLVTRYAGYCSACTIDCQLC